MLINKTKKSRDVNVYGWADRRFSTTWDPLTRLADIEEIAPYSNVTAYHNTFMHTWQRFPSIKSFAINTLDTAQPVVFRKTPPNLPFTVIKPEFFDLVSVPGREILFPKA